MPLLEYFDDEPGAEEGEGEHDFKEDDGYQHRFHCPQVAGKLAAAAAKSASRAILVLQEVYNARQTALQYLPRLSSLSLVPHCGQVRFGFGLFIRARCTGRARIELRWMSPKTRTWPGSFFPRRLLGLSLGILI